MFRRIFEALGLVPRRDKPVRDEQIRRILAKHVAAARAPDCARSVEPLPIAGSAALSAPRGDFGKRWMPRAKPDQMDPSARMNLL